jgi:predicted MFS family arabinose efflux permease
MNIMQDHHGTHHHHRRPLTGIGLFICLMGILSIMFSITLRVIPTALQTEILALLHTTPEALNNLNIIYQYSLIASLVLSGLFVDIVGPRTVLVVGIALAAVCDYLFDHTDSVSVLMDSRIIIGYTHPFILTSVLTLGAHWLPRRHFSLFVGLLFGTLLMTPVVIYPIVHIIHSHLGLDKLVFLLNELAVIIIISIILTERIADRTRHPHDFVGIFKPLTYYKVWLICIVSMLGWMSNTFLLHYGPFYLVSHYNFDARSANEIIDTSFSCFGIGAIFMGMLADAFNRKRRHFIAVFYFLAALTFGILILFPQLPAAIVPGLIFLTAFFTSSTIICYSKASDYCPIGNTGMTLGLVLSITAIGSSLFAKITGYLLKQFSANPEVVSIDMLDNITIVVPLLLIIGGVIASTLLKPEHLTPITTSKPMVKIPPIKEKVQ